jgi:hypothetical protein
MLGPQEQNIPVKERTFYTSRYGHPDPDVLTTITHRVVSCMIDSEKKLGGGGGVNRGVLVCSFCKS